MKLRSLTLIALSLLATLMVCGQNIVGTITDQEVGDDIHLGADGLIYTSHYGGDVIRKIYPNGEIDTLILPGTNFIGAIDMAANETFYVSSYDDGWIGKFREGDTSIAVIAEGLQGPTGIETGPDHWLYITTNISQEIVRMDTSGNNRATFYLGNPLFFPLGITSNSEGDLFTTNLINGDLCRLRDGLPGEVLHSFPVNIDDFPDMGYLDYDSVYNRLYVALYYDNTIYGYDLDNDYAFWVAGSGENDYVDGDAGTAAFSVPTGLAVSSDGLRLYVTDGGMNSRLRYIDLDLSILSSTNRDNSETIFYPNPSSGVLAIRMNPIETTIHKLEIFAANGHKIFEQKNIKVDFSLDLTAKPPGVYLIKTTDENGGISVNKWVKTN